jgi:lipoprotein-anchoring transpeptidase ErfK/SrfK
VVQEAIAYQRPETVRIPGQPNDSLIIRISVRWRELLVQRGRDTLRRFPVAISSGRRLSYGGKQWNFATPVGQHRIVAKRTDPVWAPPEWHYAEVAKAHGLRLASLQPSGRNLRDGTRLVIRDSVVGILRPADTTFLVLPEDEHIVFNRTLFIPPLTTRNRQLRGELGAFSLDLGNGYMIHGTADPSSVGRDVTHGCIRMHADDLAWLFQLVPVGTLVVIR